MKKYFTLHVRFSFLITFCLIYISIKGFGQLPSGVYNAKWIDITNVTVNANNSLTVNAGQQWGYGKGANTSNVLPPNTNGWVEFASNSNGTFVIGFSTNEVVFDYNNFSYGIRNEGGSASTYETWVGTSLGTFVTGNIFRISREGSQIKYYKNGTVVRTVSTNPALELRVRAAMFEGTLPVVTTSQSPQLIVKGIVTGVTNAAAAAGSVILDVKGGTAPYTYSWTDGSNASSLTNQLPGTYSVTITDASGITATRAFRIGYKMLWKDVSGVSESSTVLTKSGAAGWGSGGNSSNFLLPNTDGWVEFVANLNSNCMVGFSSSGNSYATNDMTFGIYNEGDYGNLYSNEQWTSTTLGSFFSGDIYRISREGSQMKYYRNGTVIRTISTNAALGLSVKVLVSSGSSPIVNCSMQSALQLKASVSSIESLNGKGGISITALGGTTPYTYLWSSGETTASITGKAAGTYSVTVTDAIGRSASKTYSIAYKSIWLPGQGISENGGALTKTGSPSWGYGAYGLNYLPSNTNGWIEFVAGENATYVMGLSLAGQAFDYSNLSYGFRLEASGELTAYQDWVATSLGSYQAGDVLKIARVGTQMIYSKNGTAVKTLSVNASQILYTKASVLSGTTSAPTTQLWIPPGEGEVPDLLEFKVLKDLYDSLGGTNWTNKTNWPAVGSWPGSADHQQFSTWFGIVVKNGDVEELNFPPNGLTGKLPSSIGSLSSLKKFSSIANLISAFPSSFNGLTNLHFLNLRANRSSNLPNLSGLIKLDTLTVSYGLSNVITDVFPQWVTSLTNLVYLNLSSARFIGSIPDDIGNLNKLRFLSLQGNRFTGAIPASIGNLIHLEQFYLTSSQLSPGPIPEFIGNLTDLKTLSLSSCNLNGNVPSSLGNLINLTTLTLSGNHLSGALPTSIGNLTNLTSLNVSSNELTSIPTSIGNLQHLTSFAFSVNWVTSLPTTINQLINLESIQAAGNHFNVNLPDLSGLVSIKNFDFSNNSNLPPWSIPSWLTSLTSLNYLNLSNTNLKDNIPNEISQLIQLRDLDLHYNKLSGPIPSSWTVSQISNLDLSDNQLSGPLPDIFQNWSSAFWFYLYNNKFSGTLPPSLSRLGDGGESYSNLYYFDISNNLIEGVQDDFWEWAKKIGGVLLDGNDLRSLPPMPGEIAWSEDNWLSVINNQLDFSQLTPLQARSPNFLLTPQKLIVDQNKVLFQVGKQFKISSREVGESTSITWYKKNGENWIDVTANSEDPTRKTYLRSIASESDPGLYYWSTVDTQFPGVTVQSGVIDAIGEIEIEFSCVLQIPSRTKTDGASIIWFKKIGSSWVDITKQTEDPSQFSFLINNANQEAQGEYKWEITDSAFPGVLLKSNSIQVTKSGLVIVIPEFIREPGETSDLDQFKLTSTQVGVNYQLMLNNIDVTNSLKVGTGSPLSWSGINSPGKYSVKALAGSCNTIILPQVINQSEQYLNQTEPYQNFVKVEEMYTSDPITSAYINQKKIGYQYYDGLGRPIQAVDVKGSAYKNDLVFFNKYDVAGRQNKDYLAYSSLSTNPLYKPDVIVEQANFYNPTQGLYNSKTKTDGVPFGTTYFEPSPLNRVLSRAAPGSEWQQTENTVRYEYNLNRNGSAAGQEIIPIWNVLPVTINITTEFVLGYSTAYPSGSLYVNTTTDENGKQSRNYSDKQGELLIKKVQYSINSPQTNVDSDWAVTTYVYDDSNNLRFVLQPEFQSHLSTYLAATNSEKLSWLSKYAFEYRYDERGRVIYKKIPGATPIEMVYDQWDRLVLMRDGQQKVRGVWSFVKYDAMNRPIISGEINSSSSQPSCASSIALINNRHENVISTDEIGYSLNQTYPITTDISNVFNVIYYDNYAFVESLPGYNFSGNYFQYPKEQITGSRTRILNSSPVKWLLSVSYYDEQYRTIYSVSDDHLGNKNKIASTYYGLTPWVTKTVLEHGIALISVTENTYDHRGRLLDTYQSIDNTPKILIASRGYNDLGQLVEKNIHSTDEGTSFLQSVDYRYNIRGWLTHINNSELSVDSQHNDDDNDLFGMELNYTTSVTVGNDAISGHYNGNISSVTWKTKNFIDTPVEKIYGFRYDPLNRLSDSKYATKSGTTWTNNVGKFNEDNISYDRNGNILHLDRKSVINGNTGYIDQLNYSYDGNQLTNVTDDSPYNNPLVKGIDFGFTEIIKSSGITEYRYDENGNMKEDDNKGVISVVYNHLNLPVRVELEPQNGATRVLEYTYSAAGIKLRKVAKLGSQIVAQTDYVGAIQYENGKLQFIADSEGRLINSKVSNNTSWQREYHLKDHLGNVRVAYGYLQDIDNYSATMEIELVEEESNQFTNISSSSRSIEYNHTKPNEKVSLPNESVKLNGITGNAIGPAKMLQVTAGDQVTMEAFVYCPVSVNSSAVLPGLATAVTGAFGLLGVGETGYGALNGQVPLTAGAIGKSTNLPKAYLCYLLFNKNYEFVQHGFYSAGNEAQVGFQQLLLDVNVPSDGFMYIYVANESYVNATSSAYFDDMTVRHFKKTAKIQVTQSQDYYAFGLTFNRFQNEGVTKNDYLNNGKEFQDDFDLNWTDYGSRMYMADIGRWSASDPASEYSFDWSPYSFSYNDPISFVDDDGEMPGPVGAIIGALADYLGQVGGHYIFDGWDLKTSMTKDINYWSIGLSALSGGYSGGLEPMRIALTTGAGKKVLYHMINYGFDVLINFVQDVLGDALNSENMEYDVWKSFTGALLSALPIKYVDKFQAKLLGKIGKSAKKMMKYKKRINNNIGNKKIVKKAREKYTRAQDDYVIHTAIYSKVKTVTDAFKAGGVGKFTQELFKKDEEQKTTITAGDLSAGEILN